MKQNQNTYICMYVCTLGNLNSSNIYYDIQHAIGSLLIISLKPGMWKKIHIKNYNFLHIYYA
jgi:hypothetical protein